MTIHIYIDSMKEAEKLSGICKEYPDEILLRSEKFCIDPKSTLGILAMMYSARDQMYLDTNEMEDTDIPKFLDSISRFIVDEEAEEEK